MRRGKEVCRTLNYLMSEVQYSVSFNLFILNLISCDDEEKKHGAGFAFRVPFHFHLERAIPSADN